MLIITCNAFGVGGIIMHHSVVNWPFVGGMAERPGRVSTFFSVPRCIGEI